ncbi:lectin OAA family protein [Corallococcus silvisoli]|uniref:lectin OAA family protein n=1 Tax=Corallococcus silvisoli TaxID=2697031 RepID=UPI001376B42D|nr:lectin ESA-2 [Corallococcus silvisoli]NBD09665.1 lectin ESA-2 [Corallococcus silvisoli]
MTAYVVQNQWGGSGAPWNPGGLWVIGSRPGQGVVALNVTSSDGGKTLTGTMTYNGEGPIGFRGTLSDGNNYTVENQWGGSSAPWQPGGVWVLGARKGQHIVALNVTSSDGGNTLLGTTTYNGEGPIGFRSEQSNGGAYTVENQWGGASAPWQPGGVWVLGARKGQNVVAVAVTSSDGGKTLTGTMTYNGEGPIGFRGTLSDGNNYTVENQWGGSSAPWQPGGLWIIGARQNQNVVALNFTSPDGGKALTGTTTYNGEGPIGFRGKLN